MNESSLNLMIAGTEDGILMIEGAADFLPEETLIEALRAGHEAIKTICRALRWDVVDQCGLSKPPTGSARLTDCSIRRVCGPPNLPL